MGLIWNTMRFARVPERALMLQEKAGTLSKMWSLFGHIDWYRCLLKVVSENPRQPYYLYRYIEGKQITRYHLLIHTPHVMVRVGPEKTYFWAETRTHQPLPLTFTGIKKAGILVRNKTHGITNRLREYLYTRA